MVPELSMHVGYIAEDVDPSKGGKVRLIIESLAWKSKTSFQNVVFPFGTKGPLRRGQQVLVFAQLSPSGSVELYVLGALYPVPSAAAVTGSQAPLAQSEPIPTLGPIDAGKYANLHVVEVDPQASPSEAWIVKIKGLQTSILVDGATEQIIFNPGGQNIVLHPGTQSSARLAVEGDPVEVMSPHGMLSGRIVRGSAPMVARRIS